MKEVKITREKTLEKVGVIAFLVGIIIALILSIPALGGIGAGVASILIVLGIIVGIINIGDEEVHQFLLAALVFIVSAGYLMEFSSMIPAIGGWVKNFMTAVILFVAPGAAITALRALYEVARSK